MTTKNDITGDSIVSKPSSQSYRDGWDAIFGNKENTDSDKKHNNEDLIHLLELGVNKIRTNGSQSIKTLIEDVNNQTYQKDLSGDLK